MMVSNNQNSDLIKTVKNNILTVLKEKEQELDDIIHDYSVVENKFSKDRDDETIERLRETRLRNLKEQFYKKQEYLLKGFGRVIEIGSDKEFFDACRDIESVVVHFYLPSTPRCNYLGEHLEKTADLIFDTKFIKVNAEKTPFICERFNIWCIPTLMIIKQGKTDHSIVGFDEFGGDGFSTETLEKVLRRHINNKNVHE